jgi:membrane protein involved in colicin uptake
MENKKSKTRNIISIVLVALIGLLVWSMVIVGTLCIPS